MATTTGESSTDRPYKIITLNIAGLITRGFRGKPKLLAEIAHNDNAVIISLTESHLTENIREAEINIPHYTYFRTDRSNQRKKGGVVTYVMSNQDTEVLLSESNSYVEAQIIYIRQIEIVYVNIYRPPACPTTKFNEPLTKINTILNSLHSPTPTIMLTGDLNFPNINWEAESVYGGAGDMRDQAEALLRLAEEHCLTQIINVPTRGDNILDIVMTNNEDIFFELMVQPTHLSDHNIVTLTTNLLSKPFHNDNRKATLTTVGFNDLNYFSDTICWENIKRDLDQVNWEQELKDVSPEVQYKKIILKCKKISEAHVPKKKILALQPNNIPRDRKVLMRKRTKLRRKLRETSNEQRVRRIENKINILEAKLKISVDNEMAKKEAQAISYIKTNPKYFYRYAATKSKTRTSIGPLIDAKGQTVSHPQEIADELMTQYDGVFSIPRQDKVVASPSEFFFTNNDTDYKTDLNFTPTTIQEAIKKVAANAASGPDEFPAKLLKSCAKELSVPLFFLYRNSLDKGIIPQILKYAKITPIYKGGSKSQAQNYRPVALTSHIMKILEKIIVMDVGKYLEDNDKMNEDQHGFRMGRSCLTQLLNHHEKIINALAKDKVVDVVYLDFAKAFDKVDHGILLHKMRSLGISGKLGVWLHTFLTGREQRVAVDGAVSRSSAVSSGVPQGSVLGPLLFLIHLSDINTHVQHSSVALFADDTRVIKEVSTEADRELLQEDLEILYRWTEQNNMSLNNNKFEHLTYKNAHNTNASYIYKAHDGSDIENKQNVRDLGVTMSCDGTFTTHINNVTKKARSQSGWVLRTFQTRDKFPMMTLYKSLIVPLLEYSCQLWSPWKVGEKQQLEAVQRSFTSKIIDCRKLNYWERLKSLNLYSLERRRERYIIIYIYKILIGNTVNNIGVLFYIHERLGRFCHIPPLHPRAGTRIKTLKENSFATRGPRLFNELPKYLRNSEVQNVEKFKRQLDSFLGTIPDEPKLPHYYLRASSNSIIDQLAQRRADGLF